MKHPTRSSYTVPMGYFVSNSQQSDYPSLVIPPFSQSVAVIVFGDGSKSKLYPLTKRRSEGAIPIAANYRLIDAVVSNCINSNISKVYALTQFNSTSLNSHLSRAYSGVGLRKEGFLEVIAAYQSPEDEGWFQGTADAVRRCLWVLDEHPTTEFLVLPGHHLYRMDYQKLIEAHRNSKADITVAASSATTNRDPGFGLLKVDSHNQVLELEVKPKWEPLNSLRETGQYNSNIRSFRSMGIYVINRDAMIRLLREDFPKANEFANEVIPGAISIGMKVGSYIFDGYWEDMRNIEAFYQANMESRKRSTLGFNFHDRRYPMYTLPRCLPPTVIKDAEITDSIIGDGCVLNSCKITDSVVGMRTWVGDSTVIESSVIMGADIYQTDEIHKENIHIPIGIGEGSCIKKAIIDKNARIGKNVKILNIDNVQEGNREDCGYVISSGIVVVLKSAVIQDGTII
ncbi:hypothetical protein GIB67_008479 [Kingdonia uniflora]|uniref:Nucleotidyl transferase domain-containing protein n=1 Tax=Kingdonia uniflora TaxID=39325 RepID=A0A7J7N5R5_9MAGN|nr:hypothetical protein GIB67_008479 [Kingdonia uniflora]